MGRKLTLEIMASRLPDNLVLDFGTYRGIYAPARFIDSEYGEFWTSFHNVSHNKQQHPDRPRRKNKKHKVKPLSDVTHKIPKHISIKAETYQGVNYKATFVDEIYGEFKSEPAKIFRGGGHPKRAIDQRAKQATHTIDYIKANIPDHLTIVEKTYIQGHKKALFIDKRFGEFWCAPNSVMALGQGHPERGRQAAASKGAKNKVLYHWKDNRELVCMGSWEIAVVNWLNELKIEYDWQIPFKMPTGRTYIMDLYLINENRYVEIKGYFREVGLAKWEWFHSVYPNSEIWNGAKLMAMGLIPLNPQASKPRYKPKAKHP